MNPLASPKCVLCVFAALAVVGLLLFAAGCGSSGGLPPILGGNYSAASLKGQYVISQTGIGINQSGVCCDSFSETIVFTADGVKNLSVGVDDFNQTGQGFEDTNLTGSYGISKDGTGFLTINFGNNVTANYAITMIDDNHFYVIEQDTYATSGGFGEMQNAAAFAALPTGNFVFKTHTEGTSSRVGGIAVTAGNIAGNQDLLNIGFPSTSGAISGSFSGTLPDSNGRGQFSLSDGTTFNYYVVNGGAGGKAYILSSNGTLEIGQAEAQSAGPFSVATLPNSTSYVFGSAGDTTSSGQAGIHSAGVFSTDGNGNITSGGTVDYVQDVTVNSNLAVTGGSYTLAANGRGQINLTLTGGTISPQIFWIVNSTPGAIRAYFLVDSTTLNAVEDGTFLQQQGAPFSAVGAQAAFVMDGFDTAFKDRTGAFQPTTGGNFKWTQSSNSFDTSVGGVGSPASVGTTGTLTVSSNGRVTATVNGISAAPNVWIFYLSSASSGVMIQEDATIGGAFTVQAGQ